MERVSLGRSELQVSRLCLGTMTFGAQADEAAASAILDEALEAGIDFLDTANVYPLGASWSEKGETERLLGRWLRGRRGRIVLATKAGSPMGKLPGQGGTSRAHLLQAIDDSLQRLGIDHIDLYQLHRDDPDTPLDETLEALDTIVRSGRARCVGVSNWTAWRIARALGRAECLRLAPLVAHQGRYNLLFRQPERDLLPLCQAEGLATLCYNPLAGGLLTGKHRPDAPPAEDTRFNSGQGAVMYRERYWHAREFAAVQAIVALAREAGLSPVAMSVAWVLQQPGVTCAIVGASRPGQLGESIAGARLLLEPALLERLDEITREFRRGDAAR